MEPCPQQEVGASRSNESTKRTARSDPKTHVTPDAFHVDAALLGQPLASPSRRAVALFFDLVLVAVLASLGFAALTIAVGAFLLRFGRKRAQGLASRRSAMVVGAALMLLGLLTFLLEPFGRFATEFIERENPAPGVVEGKDLLGLLADDPAQVKEAARRLATSLEAAGGRPEEAEQALAELQENFPVTPERADWIREGFAAGFAPATVSPHEPDLEAREVEAARRMVTAAESERPEELSLARTEMRTLLAGGELELLSERNEKLMTRLRELNTALAAERTKPVSLLTRARATAEDIGITFFWSTLYFTTFIGLFRGRTPGKRLLGLQVVRLDGGRLTVWNAFERHGGYLAGTATGLLGFLQILWDPNRQAIQDKIAGTVVIRLGKPKIAD